MSDTYAVRAQRALDGLTRAAALAKADKDDDAQALLTSLKPDVASLREMASGMHVVVQAEEDLAQRSLDGVHEAIANTIDAENKTRVTIAKKEAERAGDLAKYDQLLKDTMKYIWEMIGLSQRIKDLQDDLHDHQDKMKKFFWVPGYNVYLAIRNIKDVIDKKQGELNGVKKNLEDVKAKMPELQKDAAALQQAMGALDVKLKDLFADEGQQKALQGRLEEAKKNQAAMVSAAARVKLFYDDLAVVLDATGDALDNTSGIAGQLDTEVKFVDDSGSLVTGTLRKALLYLTQHADASTQQIYLFENVGDGPPQHDGGAIAIANSGGSILVPFKVTTTCHVRGVKMFIAGQDLIVQLGTGPNVPEPTGPYKVQPIPDPKVVASKSLPGQTKLNMKEVLDISIPGAYVLIPGEQYFVILTSAHGDGSWLYDTRAGAGRVGMGQPGDRKIAASIQRPLALRVYGTAVVGNLQMLTRPPPTGTPAPAPPAPAPRVPPNPPQVTPEDTRRAAERAAEAARRAANAMSRFFRR